MLPIYQLTIENRVVINIYEGSVIILIWAAVNLVLPTCNCGLTERKEFSLDLKFQQIFGAYSSRYERLTKGISFVNKQFFAASLLDMVNPIYIVNPTSPFVETTIAFIQQYRRYRNAFR